MFTLECPSVAFVFHSSEPNRRHLSVEPIQAWGEEIRALEVEIKARQTVEDDISHLQTIRMWANASLVTGLALCPFTPLSSIFISTAIMARWTMIGHHVCHGGYNSLQSDDGKVTGLFHRRTFALGPQRRILDWLDWMLPEAWDVEHNNLHHYKLGESGDPDLVERNLEDIIRWQKPKGVPAWLRTAQVWSQPESFRSSDSSPPAVLSGCVRNSPSASFPLLLPYHIPSAVNGPPITYLIVCLTLLVGFDSRPLSHGLPSPLLPTEVDYWSHHSATCPSSNPIPSVGSRSGSHVISDWLLFPLPLCSFSLSSASGSGITTPQTR